MEGMLLERGGGVSSLLCDPTHKGVVLNTIQDHASESQDTPNEAALQKESHVGGSMLWLWSPGQNGGREKDWEDTMRDKGPGLVYVLDVQRRYVTL